ncbi:MAG: phospholipase D-like domain-containing protein [Patescibacteria group bacterium]
MIKQTSWTLYTSNEDAWMAMLSDCAKAEKSIELEQFIFAADDFGNKLINVCAERASKGVKVRFLWDAGGSFTFWGSNIVEDLKKKGIELVFWKTLIPPYYKVPNFRSWFLRNHHRTLAIDGKVAYTGSICMRERMINWRDTNVRFEGPVVSEMENVFDRMWARSLKIKPLPKRRFAFDPDFRYITNYPAPGQRHINNELMKSIKSAEKYIDITTPYFIPTHRILHAIKLAAKRKIRVRIILPEKTDDYVVDLGMRSYFKGLLESGVKIYLYKKNIIHSKSVVIDGNWSTVGTLNLDNVSLLYNFEANIISNNKDFAEELEAHFIHDLKKSEEVNLIEWQKRFFLEKLAEFSVRLIRKFL